MGQAAVGGGVDVGLALADRRGRRVGARDHHRLEGVKLRALTRDRGAVRVLAWQEVVGEPHAPVTAVPDPGAPDLDAIVLRGPGPVRNRVRLPLGVQRSLLRPRGVVAGLLRGIAADEVLVGAVDHEVEVEIERLVSLGQVVLGGMGIAGHALGQPGLVGSLELRVVGVDVHPFGRREREKARDVALAAVGQRLGRRTDRVRPGRARGRRDRQDRDGRRRHRPPQRAHPDPSPASSPPPGMIAQTDAPFAGTCPRALEPARTWVWRFVAHRRPAPGADRRAAP